MQDAELRDVQEVVRALAAIAAESGDRGCHYSAMLEGRIVRAVNGACDALRALRDELRAAERYAYPTAEKISSDATYRLPGGLAAAYPAAYLAARAAGAAVERTSAAVAGVRRD